MKICTSTIIAICFSLVITSCKKKTENKEEASIPPPVTNPVIPTPPPCDSTCWIRLNLDENANDTSCNNMIPQINNMSFITDRNGNTSKAILFNGQTGSNIIIAGATYTRPDFPFSVSFWLNPADSSNSVGLINSGQNSASADFGYNVSIYQGGIYSKFGNGMAGGNGFRFANTSSVIRSNMWTHVTIVFNAGFYFYVNGVLQSSSGFGNASTIAYGTGDYFSIGNSGPNALTIPTGIKLDKIKIWKKDLNATEILDEVNSPD